MRKKRDSQASLIFFPDEENFLSLITKLQQQLLNCVETNVLHRFLSEFCVIRFHPILPSSQLFFCLLLCSSVFSPICDSLHAVSCLICKPSHWLPYFFSNVVRKAATPVWVTALRLNLYFCAWQGEKKGQNLKQRQGLSCPTRGKDTDTERESRSRVNGDKAAIFEVFTMRKQRQPVAEYSCTSTAGSPLFSDHPSH